MYAPAKVLVRSSFCRALGEADTAMKVEAILRSAADFAAVVSAAVMRTRDGVEVYAVPPIEFWFGAVMPSSGESEANVRLRCCEKTSSGYTVRRWIDGRIPCHGRSIRDDLWGGNTSNNSGKSNRKRS